MGVIKEADPSLTHKETKYPLAYTAEDKEGMLGKLRNLENSETQKSKWNNTVLQSASAVSFKGPGKVCAAVFHGGKMVLGRGGA